MRHTSLHPCRPRAVGALVAGALLAAGIATPPRPALAAAARSPLVGRSYCFQDNVGSQRFIFTRQTGNKLLGSITAYNPQGQQAWRFPLLAGPKADGATATIDGDQFNVQFYSPHGEPAGHNEMTVDPASDTITGQATIAAGSATITLNRC